MKTWIVFLLLAFTVSADEFDRTKILVRRKTDVGIAAIDQFQPQSPFHRLRWSILRPAANQDPEAMRVQIEASGLFDIVTFARIVHTCVEPNDVQWTNQWGPMKIQAPAAWSFRPPSNNVIVAVIDTGIDFNHEDLRDNLWTGPAGEHGYTVFNAVITEGGMDDHFHGTHVSGTIGAVGNNMLGIAGLNWRCQLMALKFLDSSGSGIDSDAALAIEKMVELKDLGYNIRVSNNSWGGGGGSPILLDAFRLAEQSGIINIAAAGNSNLDIDDFPFFPAGLPLEGIISVLASDVNDDKAGFSNYGLQGTDLFAPGVGILSCRLGGGYWLLSGTSMASPHVAGVVAAMFGIQPSLDVLSCRSILLDKDSLDHVAFMDNSTLGGRLNMFKAVSNPRLINLPPNTNLPPVLTLNVQTNLIVLQPGESATVSATASDPNGDVVQFRSTSVGEQDKYDLFLGFSGHLRASGGSPTLTLTNLPRALDMAVRQSFFVTDGHGGSDAKSVTFFMRRDETKLRNLSTLVGPLAIQPTAPYYTITLPTSVPATYEYQHATQYGATYWCCTPGNQSGIIGQLGGLNIVHPWVVDEFGNFSDLPAVYFNLGGSNPPPPIAKVKVDKVSGPSPLVVIADMSETDPGRTNDYYYFRNTWQGGIGDLDWRNPVKTFTLTPLGLHAVEFMVWEPNIGIWDESVVLFTVLPAGMTNEPPPPPPPPVLLAPSNLSVTASTFLLTLQWQDNSTGEDRQVLEYRTKAKGPWTTFRTLATLPENVESFTLTPSRSTQYEFRMKACKDTICSPYSNSAGIRVR